MAEPARNTVRLQDFPGLATRVDPNDLPAGATKDQLNAQSHHPGELRIRLGIKELTFEED